MTKNSPFRLTQTTLDLFGSGGHGRGRLSVFNGTMGLPHHGEPSKESRTAWAPTKRSVPIERQLLEVVMTRPLSQAEYH
jgi:hypothetical protein